MSDFESKMKNLEKITRDLEKSDMSLDDAMQLYAQGVSLAAELNHTLSEMESRMTVTVIDQDGKNSEMKR